MALRSLVQLRGFFDLIPGGSKNINPSDLQNNDPPSVETQLVLANGANTITVPAKAEGALIIFDSTSTVVKTLKGLTGDTGIVVRPNAWCVLTFDTTSPIASFVIDASTADTGKYTNIVFF